MRKIFLSSSGFAPETKKDFLEFIGKDPKTIKIGFIPTASDMEENPTYVQDDLDSIEEYGMAVAIVDLKNENAESLYSQLKDVDIILLEGGNTFYLLEWIRKSGFDTIIGKLLGEGKIYYGISAGSYVACATIEATTWKHADRNFNKLEDLTGLALVPFLISAHYNREKYHVAVAGGVSTTKLPVVALLDSQAIIVEDDKYKVVGTGERNFFNGFKE